VILTLYKLDLCEEIHCHLEFGTPKPAILPPNCHRFFATEHEQHSVTENLRFESRVTLEEEPHATFKK
jgi:hypothetical protein